MGITVFEPTNGRFFIGVTLYRGPMTDLLRHGFIPTIIGQGNLEAPTPRKKPKNSMTWRMYLLHSSMVSSVTYNNRGLWNWPRPILDVNGLWENREEMTTQGVRRNWIVDSNGYRSGQDTSKKQRSNAGSCLTNPWKGFVRHSSLAQGHPQVDKIGSSKKRPNAQPCTFADKPRNKGEAMWSNEQCVEKTPFAERTEAGGSWKCYTCHSR